MVVFPAVPVLWEEQSATVTLEKKRFLIEHLTLKVNADARRLEQGGVGRVGDDVVDHAAGRRMAEIEGQRRLAGTVAAQLFGLRLFRVYRAPVIPRR